MEMRVQSILSGNYLTHHKQHMVTPDQWIMPFNIIIGLTRTPMQPSMDEDLHKFPHVIITSDDIWDPSVLDYSIDIMIFTIPLWLQKLMKILHILMNAHP